MKLSVEIIFQSTHPTRGATFDRRWHLQDCHISIHAPHTGCDKITLVDIPGYEVISIHAPHTGCDSSCPPCPLPAYHFNPRTPHGVRHGAVKEAEDMHQFQSTHPTRGATYKYVIANS